MEQVHLVAVEEYSAVAVANKGVIIPAIPKPRDHLDGTLSSFIAVGMWKWRGAVKVEGLDLEPDVTHIPARPAAADMIERGEFSRDMVRLVEAG